MGVTSALRRAAQIAPKRDALIFGDRTLCWRDLGERVPRLAGVLIDLGVATDDRVAVLAQNSGLYCELFLAIAWAGAVVVPVNWRWNARELDDVLADAEPKVLVVDAAMMEAGRVLCSRSPQLSLVSIGEEDVPGVPRIEALVAQAEAVPDAARSGDDLYGIFYTGGTTGRAKGVMLSHRNVLSGAVVAQCEGYFGADAVCLVAAPFFHAAGSWPWLSLVTSAGTAVVMGGYDPAHALALIARHRVTETLLVPAMLQMLIEHPAFADADVSTLKTMLYGGSPITGALLDRAVEALPGARFSQVYGMTELSPQVAVLHHQHLQGDYRARGVHRAAGRACYGQELMILDDAGREAPRGVMGEIAARGDSMMLGYWKRPDETAAVLRDGWMHTGDGGRMDEDGFVYVVDRLKDMIISGGENIYSIEVENVIAQHPAVQGCVVIGVPHPLWVEQVHAVVILREGAEATPEELIEYARGRLAGYKAPRTLELRREPFPLSPANKVLKRVLRDPYWSGRETGLS